MELPTIERPDADDRIWLENVEGTAALDWVKAKNAEALSLLGNPSDSDTYKRILSILDSKEKIPYIGRVFHTPSGETHYYNFWQDEKHVRGIWRRTSLDEYRKPLPSWETVLDLDVLSKEEGVTWVWGGSTPLEEGPDVPTDRCIIKLSRGGADAKVAREFDVLKKRFVPESEGGFVLPEAKSSLCYKDRDTLLVGGSFFGAGALTDSGYPRTVREWKRGTKLESAVQTYEGLASDVAVHGYAYLDRGHAYEIRHRAITFYTTYYEARVGKGGAFAPVHVPEDAQLGTFADQIMITLRSEWLGYAAGALLVAPAVEFMAAGGDKAKQKPLLTPLFEPTATCSLEGSSESLSYVILQILDNVRSELRFIKYDKAARTWTLTRTFRGEGFASLSASGVKADSSDEVWLTSSSYIQPTTYSLASAHTPAEQTKLKALPSMYDASGCVVEQYEAPSADGTMVPYFLVSRKGMRLDGSTPTLLYGYGGFEISLTPSYAATVGVGWLEKGYAYVQANIRGGGEFGPSWHQVSARPARTACPSARRSPRPRLYFLRWYLVERSTPYSLPRPPACLAPLRRSSLRPPPCPQAALKAKRHKAYEDFEAVAKHLVQRGVTSPSKLGIQGGSNGGLLMGNMLARSPELFGAIVCQVPLLDMRRCEAPRCTPACTCVRGSCTTTHAPVHTHRYNKLLAGASWMGEFGNPDVEEEWSFLQHYSPYHTVRAGALAPPTLFTTSTRDDRVHPGHARKLLGKMVDLRMPGIGYENIEGGHGGAADNKQRAFMSVLAWSFLEKTIVSGTLAASLTRRTNLDGGRRPARSLLAKMTAGSKGSPKWLVTVLGAAALGVAVMAERRRVG